MPESTAKTGKANGRVEGTAGLARHLGISRWTVSRVLNGHEGVKEETRRRVLGAMEELGFAPNRMARGLRGVPSGLVGVSFPHLEAIVLAQKSQVLQDELWKAGYRGTFEMPEGDPDVEADVVRHFLSMQVDGIVLIGSTLKPEAPVLKEVRARGTAIVAVDPRHALDISRVALDRGKAMELELRYLVELGHRRIGILGTAADDMYRNVRIRGLRRAAQVLGMDFAADLVWLDEEGHFQQDYGYGAILARKVLDLGTAAPTALFCLNDRIAIGVMRTLQAAGRKVPGEFSIIGFDNLPETAWSNPALTTVDQNIGTLMKTASKVLWQGSETGRTYNRKVEPRLIVRGSTGPAK